MTGAVLIYAGFLVWGGHFLASYVFAALACAHGWAAATVLGAGIVPVTIAVLTAAALALIAVAAIQADRLRHAQHRTAHFIGWLGLLVSGLSFVATILTALPVYLGPACN